MKHPFLPLCSALLVLLQDSLVTTAGPPMFSELVMKVSSVALYILLMPTWLSIKMLYHVSATDCSVFACSVSVEDDPLPPDSNRQHQSWSDPSGCPQLYEGFPQRKTQAAEEWCPTQNTQDSVTHTVQANWGQGNTHTRTIVQFSA